MSKKKFVNTLMTIFIMSIIIYGLIGFVSACDTMSYSTAQSIVKDANSKGILEIDENNVISIYVDSLRKYPKVWDAVEVLEVTYSTHELCIYDNGY